MPWSKKKSVERIEKHMEGLGEITVSPLVREANLDELLSETGCREIFGAHIYATISNFTQLSSQTTLSSENYKRMIQALHIYQREVSRIVESTFDSFRVHFQGPKVHALIYRPIRNGEAIATKAALLMLVLDDFVKTVFNTEFSTYENFILGAGADIGDVIGTKNGAAGQRELLFLGNAANQAAKIMRGTGSLVVAPDLHSALPSDIQGLCVPYADGNFKLSARQVQLDGLCAKHNIAWDREKSGQRLKDDRAAFPLTDISYEDANELIDLDSLSVRKNKRVHAASLFADISGFTAYVRTRETEKEQGGAIKLFHVIRRESAVVIRDDQPGLRIQYQGDRVQAIYHLPKNDSNQIAEDAVYAAIGLQSSMELAIKEILPEANELTFAIGIDLGTTLVTKLGERGDRDVVCLGVPVENAALLEEVSGKRVIAISKAVYDALGEELQALFSQFKEWYIAENLTADKVELASKASIYEDGGNVALALGVGAVALGAAAVAAVAIKKAQHGDETQIQPARSYAE